MQWSSGGKRWQLIETYFQCMCSLQERDLPTFKWYSLMRMAEVITKFDFWEVYLELDVINLQSSFEMVTIR